MTHEIEQLIKQLKNAPTAAEIARVTVKLLRACGVFNFQGVAQEMARICVTGDLACEKKQWHNLSNNGGYVYERNGAFHIRYYAHEGGVRKQRSYRLCSMDQDHPSKDAQAVVSLVETFMLKINLANTFNDETPFHNCPVCGNRCNKNIKQQFASQI